MILRNGIERECTTTESRTERKYNKESGFGALDHREFRISCLMDLGSESISMVEGANSGLIGWERELAGMRRPQKAVELNIAADGQDLNLLRTACQVGTASSEIRLASALVFEGSQNFSGVFLLLSTRNTPPTTARTPAIGPSMSSPGSKP